MIEQQSSCINSVDNMRKRFVTTDGCHVDTWMYNSGNYATHVFVANRKDEEVNSSNNTLYHLHGRDAYECLLAEGDKMTKDELIRMFFE